jgi:hypothetical protein
MFCIEEPYISCTHKLFDDGGGNNSEIFHGSSLVVPLHDISSYYESNIDQQDLYSSWNA